MSWIDDRVWLRVDSRRRAQNAIEEGFLGRNIRIRDDGNISWVRDLQVELKPPDVPPSNLQTRH